jgi:hypothetical protein
VYLLVLFGLHGEQQHMMAGLCGVKPTPTFAVFGAFRMSSELHVVPACGLVQWPTALCVRASPRVLLPDLPAHGARFKEEPLTLDNAMATLHDVITQEVQPGHKVRHTLLEHDVHLLRGDMAFVVHTVRWPLAP